MRCKGGKLGGYKEGNVRNGNVPDSVCDGN